MAPVVGSDRSRVAVATKGGLVCPRGAWAADGPLGGAGYRGASEFFGVAAA